MRKNEREQIKVEALKTIYGTIEIAPGDRMLVGDAQIARGITQALDCTPQWARILVNSGPVVQTDQYQGTQITWVSSIATSQYASFRYRAELSAATSRANGALSAGRPKT